MGAIMLRSLRDYAKQRTNVSYLLRMTSVHSESNTEMAAQLLMLPFNCPGFLSGSKSSEIRLSPSPESSHRSTGKLESIVEIICPDEQRFRYLVVSLRVTLRTSIESRYQPAPRPLPS